MQANTFASKMLTWRMCIILVLVGLVASAALAADVTGVNVVNKSDRVVITVDGSGPLKMAVLTSGQGNYLGFQFQGHLTAKGRLVGIRSGRIYNVRYSRYAENPPLTRVVVNTTAHLDYSTQWNDDKTRVEITVWKFGASPAKTEAETRPAEPAVTSDFMPVLPPVEMTESQGSDTPGPDPAPAVSAKPVDVPVVTVKPVAAPVSVKPAAVPAKKPAMQVARIAPSTPPALARAAEAPAKPAASGAGKAISLNFLGADIGDVLKALAVQSGENIVVGSDVAGKITVTLDGVTVDEALDYITRLTGYNYVKDQHTYLVGSPDNVGGLTNAKVEIITLAYANADDVLELLKSQCPQIRASKISVRGGKARKHEQTLEQGKKRDTKVTEVTADDGSKVQKTETAPAKPAGDGTSAQPAQGSKGSTPSSTTSGAKGVDESITSSTAADSPSSDMIAIVGTVEKIADAKGFIAQIEDAMKGQADGKKIGVYEVKYVNTQELANTIMSLVLGVSVTLAPSAETSPVTAGQGQKIVPISMLSGEKTDRPFDTEKNAFSHTLIVVGSAEDVQKAMDTAAQFDRPGETDLATYKVRYVDPDLLAKTIRQLVPAVYVEGLGITDSGSAGAATASAGAETGAGAGAQSAQGSGGGTSGQTSAMNAAMVNNLSRTLVVTGRKGDVDKARALAEALDVKSPQIRIEAKITSLTESGEKQLGLSWNWGTISFNEAFTDFNKATSSTPAGGENIHNAKREQSQWIRQPINFSAKLDALITSGNGKLLAAPSMVCLEGKPGQFFVGDQIRYLVMVQQTAQGANVQTETANVGVQLSVVGNVSDEGFITLNLHPEVSVVKLDQTEISGVGALTLPTITRRYTDHVVRVKDGSTIVIGGLINDQDILELSKVPILGDLPVLGTLFRHTHKTKDHSEVVIFITASIVKD